MQPFPTSALLLLALGTVGCEGTFVLEPNDPRIDLTRRGPVQTAQPLILVDGNVSDLATLHELSPVEIKRIEVVKGAAALALYGEPGRHGVIQIYRKTDSSASVIKAPRH